MENDPFDLERFVKAQNPVYEDVLAELRAGQKTSHWMWFIFPQWKGLGYSATAQRYGIGSLAEADAYLKHPVLGSRLRECVGILNALENRSADQIFGYPDNLKLRSSLTLFAQAAPNECLFSNALNKYFDGQRDSLTIEAVNA